MLIDVLGPNNIPVLTSTAGGPYTAKTKYGYVGENVALVEDVAAASAAAPSDEKLPVIPNGLVDGEVYADARSTAAGTGYTQRLMADAVAGMAENFMGGPNAAWNVWKTNAAVEAHADMVVHAEQTLGKGVLCCAYLWSAYASGVSEDDAVARSQHCLEYRIAPWVLGQAGLSPFSYQDDSPGLPHRRLDYPTPDNPGTPSNGRRRKFQSQFYPGSGRWFDRLLGLGAPLTPGYTKSKNGIAGMYWRAYEHGEIWFNNTIRDRNVTILGGAADRYVTFNSATERIGGTTQVVPARRSLVLIYSRTMPTASTYTTIAADDVDQDGATIHATTNDTTVTGCTFNLSDGRHFTAAGAGPDYEYDLAGKLRADTAYTYTATFHTATGNHPSTNAATGFTTDEDTVAPVWVDDSPQVVIVEGRVTIDSFNVYDYEAVVRYDCERTGGAGPKTITVVGPYQPYLIDPTVDPDEDYTYTIVAKDAAGNESDPLDVEVHTLPAGGDPNQGSHVGPIMS